MSNISSVSEDLHRKFKLKSVLFNGIEEGEKKYSQRAEVISDEDGLKFSISVDKQIRLTSVIIEYFDNTIEEQTLDLFVENGEISILCDWVKKS